MILVFIQLVQIDEEWSKIIEERKLILEEQDESKEANASPPHSVQPHDSKDGE